MKTFEQVVEEIGEYGDVFTIEDFADMVDIGSINRYDGHGYFHDGENETNISVWDDDADFDSVVDCPYVCWYNK